MECKVQSAKCRVSLPCLKGGWRDLWSRREGFAKQIKDHVVVDEESPVYDYCMVLAECRVQSAELRMRRIALTVNVKTKRT